MIGYILLGVLILIMVSFLTWVVFYSKKKNKEGWGK